MSVRFALEKVDNSLGIPVDTVVKYTDRPVSIGDTQVPEREEWCNVMELDRLFDACVAKWGSNWDLEKVITAVREADFL